MGEDGLGLLEPDEFDQSLAAHRDSIEEARIGLWKLPSCHQDPLMPTDPKLNLRKYGAHRLDDRGNVLELDVVELDPLLNDAIIHHATSAELIELATVQIPSRGKPNAGELDRDQVVAMRSQQQMVSTIAVTNMDVWRVEHAEVDVL